MIESDRDEPTEDDVQWCHDAVQRVSRTFSLTVSELEDPMTDYICVGYLLCRIADTVEDATHVPPQWKRRLLETYRDAIDPTDPTTPGEFRSEANAWRPNDPDDDWQVLARTPRVVRVFRGFDDRTREAMRPSVVEMIGGMGTFVRRYADEGGIRIETVDELEEYCWYVAGTVSTLVTNLLVPDATDSQERRMWDHAEDFALLLQLVNIAKDARGDYREENNVYIPRSLLEGHGLEPTDVGNSGKADHVAPVVRAVTDRAETYADGAEAWLAAMPDARGMTRSSMAVPFLLAVATIRELTSRPEDVVAEGEVKIERAEVYELLERFHTGEPSVAGLRETMRNRPLHQS